MTYVPISVEDAQSVVGEGIHTGLRKGTDAPEAGELWDAIRASDRAWSDAIAFFVDGLEVMGMAICRKEE